MNETPLSYEIFDERGEDANSVKGNTAGPISIIN